MPDKGTVDRDYSQDAWLTVNGNDCYIQRTIMFRPDSITFPKKYRHKLPCLVEIKQKFKRGEQKGELLYPDLYILRRHMLLTKAEHKIQRKKVTGYIVPIQELDVYIGQELR